MLNSVKTCKNGSKMTKNVPKCPVFNSIRKCLTLKKVFVVYACIDPIWEPNNKTNTEYFQTIFLNQIIRSSLMHWLLPTQQKHLPTQSTNQPLTWIFWIIFFHPSVQVSHVCFFDLKTDQRRKTDLKRVGSRIRFKRGESWTPTSRWLLLLSSGQILAEKPFLQN